MKKRGWVGQSFVVVVALHLQVLSVFAQRPFWVTEQAVPVEKGRYLIQSGLSLDRHSARRQITTLGLDVRHAPLYDLEVGIQVPYLFAEEGGSHENQVGDLLLRTKVRFLRGRAANPLSIAGQILVKIPSAGRDDLLKTTGEADVGLFGLASKVFDSLNAHVNLGYVFVGNPAGGEKADELRYALGLEVNTLNPDFFWIGELVGSAQVGSPTSNGPWSVMGGIRYQAEDAVTLDASAAFGITREAPDFSVNLGVTYAIP
jgi:hypothetical protein